MARVDPDQLQLERPPGRFRAAWLVLRGQPLVPQQIRAEWLEYQQIFDDVLQRLSAQLARQAKSEKRRLESLFDQQPLSRDVPPPRSKKEELRSRVAAMRGVGPQLSLPNGSDPLPQEEEETP